VNEKSNYLEQAKGFVKRHKTKIIVGGIAVVTTVLVVKNWDWIMECFTPELLEGVAEAKDSIVVNTGEVIKNTVVDIPIESKIISYDEFIRNLPKGHKPSLGKVASALERGIELAENQTLVSAHIKLRAA